MSKTFQESPEIPNLVYDVHGLKRSGHHAVIRWLIGCHEASGLRVIHINDVEPINPAKHPKPAREALAEAAGSDVLIINHEDTYFWQRENGRTRQGLRTAECAIQDIIVIRDWYNLAASWVHKIHRSQTEFFQSGVSWTSGIGKILLWREQAEIAYEPCLGRIPIVVSYNDWFASNGYRQNLADTLCLELASPEVLNSVPPNGMGSSVDNLSYDGSAQAMNVLARWRDLKPEAAQTYLRYICGHDLAVVGMFGSIDASGIDFLNRQLFGFGRNEVLADMDQCPFAHRDRI